MTCIRNLGAKMAVSLQQIVTGLGPGALDSDGIPENERDWIPKGYPDSRIPNHRSPNHQLYRCEKLLEK